MRNEIEIVDNQIEDSEALLNLVAAIFSNYKEDYINSDMCLIHYIFFEMKNELALEKINNLNFDRMVYPFSRELYETLYELEKSLLKSQTINNETYYVLSNIKLLKDYYMSKFSLDEQEEIVKSSTLLNTKIHFYKPEYINNDNLKTNITYISRKSLR